MTEIVPRRSKRNRTPSHPIDYLPAYSILPPDLIRYLLIFVINAKSAVVTWKVCKLWRSFTLYILPKIVTNWDFVNHGTLDLNGRAIWSGSFLNIIRKIDYRNRESLLYTLKGKRSSDSKVDVILPNILEFFDSQSIEYKYTLRVHCPCTSWGKESRISFLNGVNLEFESVNLIRQNKHGQLLLKKQNGKRYHPLTIPIWVDTRIDYIRVAFPEIPLGPVKDPFEKLGINEDFREYYDCKISMETFKKFSSLFWRSVTGRIKIVNGVFILSGTIHYYDSESRDSDQTANDDSSDGVILLWNDDKLKLKDVKALWNSDSLKCNAEYIAIDRWIHHIMCIGDFEFIYFRKVHFGGGYNLQTLVDNSEMSLFSEIASVHFFPVF